MEEGPVGQWNSGSDCKFGNKFCSCYSGWWKKEKIRGGILLRSRSTHWRGREKVHSGEQVLT